MKKLIRISVDFNNTDKEKRIRLNTVGTLDDLKLNSIELKPGLEIILDDEEGVNTIGVVEFSESEKIWVAKINWDSIL